MPPVVKAGRSGGTPITPPSPRSAPTSSTHDVPMPEHPPRQPDTESRGAAGGLGGGMKKLFTPIASELIRNSIDSVVSAFGLDDSDVQNILREYLGGYDQEQGDDSE